MLGVRMTEIICVAMVLLLECHVLTMMHEKELDRLNSKLTTTTAQRDWYRKVVIETGFGLFKEPVPVPAPIEADF